MKLSYEEKRRQLERRGWSKARIDQYMKDWKFHIPPTRSPHRSASDAQKSN